EYDELFKIGYRSIVESLVVSAEQWPDKPDGEESRSEALVSCLEKLTESLLQGWLGHSRTLRLSGLGRIHDRATWKKTVSGVEKYGDDILTQRLLTLGNIRAILHQGVAKWLAGLQEEPREEAPQKLL